MALSPTRRRVLFAKLIADQVQLAREDLQRALACLDGGPRPDLLAQAADLATGAGALLTRTRDLQAHVTKPHEPLSLLP